MIGQTISHYHILEAIGAGSMGMVFKAMDEKLHRVVAIKTLAPHLSADDDARRRFVEEARILSQIDHPNVGTIHEIIEMEDGRVLFVMPCYDGGSLAEMLKSGRITLDFAKDIALQIADGLSAIHRHTIVHRDLKPANILLTADGVIKVVDFGIAINTSHTMQADGNVLFGAAAYMSPEQIQGKNLDARSDIWSLGVILYEMLAGKKPFSGNDQASVFQQILLAKPEPLTMHRRDVPKEFASLVERCLRKDPNGRFENMTALAEELSTIEISNDGESHPRQSESWLKDFYEELRVRKVIRMLIIYGTASAALVQMADPIISRFELSPSLFRILILALLGGLPIALMLAWFIGNRPEIELRRTQRRAHDERKLKFRITISFTVLALAVIGIGYLITKNDQYRVEYLAVIPMQRSEGVPEWQADGLRQVANECLAGLPQLKVVSDNSVRSFMKAPTTYPEIARGLGVNAILAGAAKKLGDELQLHWTLYDTTGRETWTTSIRSNDAASLVPELAKEFSTYQSMNLNSVSARKIASYYTPQREAFEQYLRGIHESSERSERTNALALVHLKKAIQLDSVYVPALNFLAHLLEERYDKKWDESDQILQEAALYCRNSIRLDSSNSGATAMLGVIEFLRNNDSSAIALSESALRLNPNNLAALTNLGTIYIKRLNQPETGVTYFKKAQELEPLDWSVYSNLGVGYANMGNLPEAYRMWQTALRLDSSQVDVWINLGEYYLIEAKHDSAVLCFRRALAGSPLEASLYGRLATVLLSRREFAEAEQILTNGVNTLQQDVELLYLLGVTYQLANKMQEGKNILQQGRSLVVARLKNKPGDAELISTQGLFEARRGNQQAARRFATSAAAQDAHNVEVMIRVARIYSILGDKPKMLATFSAARAEDPNLDVAYLRTALDFERFRTDPDLLAIARGK